MTITKKKQLQVGKVYKVVSRIISKTVIKSENGTTTHYTEWEQSYITVTNVSRYRIHFISLSEPDVQRSLEVGYFFKTMNIEETYGC